MISASQGKAREKVFGTGPARYATPATTEMDMTATATTAACCSNNSCRCNFSFFVKAAQGSRLPVACCSGEWELGEWQGVASGVRLVTTEFEHRDTINKRESRALKSLAAASDANRV